MSSSCSGPRPANSGSCAISERSTELMRYQSLAAAASQRGWQRWDSEAFYHLPHMFHLRRLGEAMADELAPFLEIGGAAEVHRVVLHRLPFDEQAVTVRLL